MNLKTVSDNNYFGLIERVGSKGKYQRNMCIIFFLIWFVSAFFILGIAFMYMKPKYICDNIPNEIQCYKYACSLSSQQRAKLSDKNKVYSVLNQFNKQCSSQDDIANYKLPIFLGNVAGFIFFTFFADNFGRRYAVIMTMIIANIGISLIIFGNSILMISIGLFLTGSGLQSNLRINLSMLNQSVDYNLRQTYTTLMQSAYGLAGIAIGISYFYISNWYIITVIICAIPAYILLIIAVIYLEETPNFLIKKGQKAVLQSLKRIAALNGLQCQLTQQDIKKAAQVNEQQASDNLFVQKINMFDLFRYKSLKKNTILLSCIYFCISSCYLGPSAIVDNLNINPFALMIILSITDGISNPIASLFIHKIQRKQAGIKYFGLSSLFLLVSLFFTADKTCQQSCYSSYIFITLLALSRYCICYQYSILFLYTIELFPQKIRGIGFGTVSIFGSLGGVVIQKITGIVLFYNQNLLAYLLLFSSICLYCTLKLPQTLDNPLPFQIQQLKSKRIAKRYDPSHQNSIGLQQSPDSICQTQSSIILNNSIIQIGLSNEKIQQLQ